jgi:hypothetical protein
MKLAGRLLKLMLKLAWWLLQLLLKLAFQLLQLLLKLAWQLLQLLLKLAWQLLQLLLKLVELLLLLLGQGWPWAESGDSFFQAKSPLLLLPSLPPRIGWALTALHDSRALAALHRNARRGRNIKGGG